MRLILRMKTCLHLVTLAWVIVWVTSVPLFHTHLPDVNDGLASRQGLAHTIFSPDLPGEFSCRHSNVLHLSTKTKTSPELGFVISTDSHDTTFEEPDGLGLISPCLSETPLSRYLIVESDHPPPITDPSHDPKSPRAPPILVS